MTNCNLRLLLPLSFFFSSAVVAQEIGLKTNVLSDGLASPNLAVEFSFANQWSVDLSAHYNPFGSKTSSKRFKHALVQPEVRYWTKQAFKGHFVGIHVLYGIYNVGNVRFPFGLFEGVRSQRYEGTARVIGLSYGYAYQFSSRWSAEASLGLGYGRSHYKSYRCGTCGEQRGSGTKNWLGPTKVAVSLVYRLPCGRAADQRVRRSNQVHEFVQAPPVEQEAVATDTVINVTPAMDIAPDFATADSLTAASKDSICTEVTPTDIPTLYFKQNITSIDPTFADNARALETIKQRVAAINDDPQQVLTRIVIKCSASIEGSLVFNQQIAQKRAEALRDYLQNTYQLPTNVFELQATGEDWQKLEQLVTDSDMADKEQVLHIIRTCPVKAGREKQLMALKGGKPYRYMYTHFFDALRTGNYVQIYSQPQ